MGWEEKEKERRNFTESCHGPVCRFSVEGFALVHATIVEFDRVDALVGSFDRVNQTEHVEGCVRRGEPSLDTTRWSRVNERTRLTKIPPAIFKRR